LGHDFTGRASPSKQETLSSNSSTTNKQTKKKKRKEKKVEAGWMVQEMSLHGPFFVCLNFSIKTGRWKDYKVRAWDQTEFISWLCHTSHVVDSNDVVSDLKFFDASRWDTWGY
jgi:hypothetical protein